MDLKKFINIKKKVYVMGILVIFLLVTGTTFFVLRDLVIKQMNVFLLQLKLIFTSIFEHFSEFPISATFFVFIFCVFLLNIIRKIFIWKEKKNRSQNQRCKYLNNLGNEQDCDIPAQRKQFKERGNSCAGCRRKSFDMTDSEAENRIAMGYAWRYRVILLADYSKNMLPYISFLYTLAVTVFGKND